MTPPEAQRLAALARQLRVSPHAILLAAAVMTENPELDAFYDPHHPAVLRSMARVAHAAKKLGKPVSLCGEMASNPAFSRFLIGIGLTTFSVEVRSLPMAQRAMIAVNAAEAEQFADGVLRLSRVSEVADRLGLQG